MTEDQLYERLRSGRTKEGSLIERKPDGFTAKEARQTIVTFANSVGDGDAAILFIGIHDKTGEFLGVDNADSTQRSYAKALEECYPKIEHRMHSLVIEGKTIVAIVVPPSTRKPHFSGGAYVREESQNKLASDQLYQDLILNQCDKSRELVRYKNARTVVSVRGINYKLGSQKPRSGGGSVEEISQCHVEYCDGHVVKFNRLDQREIFSESLARISIEFDVANNRPRILVKGP